MISFADLLHRFRKDERGVFLVVFAVLGLVLIATSGAVVDFTRVQQARTKAQNALDAAALALSAQVGKTGVTSDTLKAQAQLLLTERVADSAVTATVETAVPDKANGKLTLTASVVIPTYFVQLVGVRTVRANMLSEVTRSSNNLEVAVAADLTYSMTATVTCATGKAPPCTRLSALKDALKTSISLLIKADQLPTYSKMAIAPYSNGVNVGVYADKVRPKIPGVRITSLTYSAGNTKNISGITRANPAVITVNDVTGIQNSDWIYISGITSGMTQINGIYGQVSNLSTSGKNFRIVLPNGTTLNTSSGYSAYTSGGTAAECSRANCRLVATTTPAHGIANNGYVHITGTTGTTGVNGTTWQITNLTTMTYQLNGSLPTQGTSTVGTSDCTTYGCEYYRYTNAANTISVFKATPCAVERTTTTNASLDTSPITDPVGIQYATIANSDYPGSITLEACPTSEIQPLTSSISTLNNLVDGFSAQGSTAGHVGLAWAWYMLSPTFTDPITTWPTSPINSRPAAYLKEDTIKALILMTDGEFNTMFHYGVPSRDADLANSTTRSNTNAPLGTSLAQAAALCTEIKKAKYGITLYTLGFGITAGSVADNSLRSCATDPSKYKTASDAATLNTAFQEIADELSNLRVSK